MDDFLKSFLEYVLQNSQCMENGKPQSENDAEEIACPRCGQLFEDIRQTGKIGCAQCYSTFRPQIAAALQNIHGSNEHKGKIPKGLGEEYSGLLIKRELESNKQLLKKAIESEQYEDAAKFRDIIRELEIYSTKE